MKRYGRVLVLGLFAVVGVCPASADDESSQPSAAGNVAVEELAASVLRVRADVEEIRGLAFKRPVPAEVIDDERARRYALERLERFYGVEAYAREERALALLGVLPRDVDTLEAYLAFLRQQAGGFYDPQTGSFYMLDDITPAMGPMIVSHELTHALEDQHFRLDERLREVRADGDRAFARSAVHEGSAMLVMTLYVTRAVARGELTMEQLAEIAESEAARSEFLADFPEPLLRPALGAYTLGMSFLLDGDSPAAALFGGFPQRRVDRSYTDGPRSSEQILHPEKYWDPAQRDDPRHVAPSRAGKALGRGWERQAQGVLGELMIGSLVGAPTPNDPADAGMTDGSAWTNEAAAGWGGDRWELWARGTEEVALLNTVWDSETDARQFAAALHDRSGLQLRQRGDRVAVIAGDAGARAGRVLKRLLAGSSR